MKIVHNGNRVKFRNIQQRSEIKPKETKKKRRRPTTYIPSIDHPWRKTYGKTTAKRNNPPLEAVT